MNSVLNIKVFSNNNKNYILFQNLQILEHFARRKSQLLDHILKTK